MVSIFSDENLDAIRHLMYLVGKNLGVQDNFNLCSGNLDDCKEYCHEILVSSYFSIVFAKSIWKLG